MMAANYRHIGGLENRLGRHYSRSSASGLAVPLLLNHLLGENRETAGRIGEVRLELQQTGQVRIRPRLQLKPGTRLMREWQGRTYEVLVLDDGFAWRGTHYRSLSAIAREITGTSWSGPLFFGLRSNRVAPRPLAEATVPTDWRVEGRDAASRSKPEALRHLHPQIL